MTRTATDPDLSIEETTRFAPHFDAAGLITCVTVGVNREVLMVAHMNRDPLDRTLATRIVHYWSRSRQSLWRKGDTSGQVQRLVELRVDCDQDVLLAEVEVGGDGGACHTGRPTCFYRRVAPDGATLTALEGSTDFHKSAEVLRPLTPRRENDEARLPPTI